MDIYLICKRKHVYRSLIAFKRVLITKLKEISHSCGGKNKNISTQWTVESVGLYRHEFKVNRELS